MRFVLIFFLFLVLLFEGVLFFAFTSPGNSMLLPFVNQYLQRKVPQAKIEIHTLRLKPDSIGLIAKINDTIDLKAQGDFDLFSQHFDIDYILDTQEIKTPSFSLKEHLHIKGNAKGKPEDMQIQGKGVAFKSTIRYGLSLFEKNPRNIQIDIKDANLASLLAVAGQKPYASGQLSLHANMPDFTPLAPKVEAVLDIKGGAFNHKLIAKDFNLTLPKKSGYQTHFTVKTKARKVTFEGRLNSSLGNLTLRQGHYQLLSNALATNYTLDIPKLEKLSSISHMPLHGAFAVEGALALKNNQPTLTGSTKSFGGTTTFRYKTDTLNATLGKVNTAKMLYKLGQPKYLSGTTTATVKLSSLKRPAGTFTLQTQGSTNRAIIKKAFELDLGKKFALNFNTQGSIKNNAITATLRAKTTMANLKSDNIHLNLKTAALKAGYLLDIPDMRKLQPLTGKPFKGAMHITGKLSKTKQLLLTGHGKEFGGTIDFKLLDEKFHADVVGVTVSKVMTMLDYPKVLEALSKATVDYNIKTASGTLHATLDNAKILPNQLTKLLKQFNVIDLTKERFNNSKFDAKISKTMIDFTLDARNKSNYFIINNGKLTKKSGAIHAKVDMKLKGKDLQATIRGTLNHPKVSFDGSAYLKNKAKAEIKKRYGKKIDKAKKSIEKKINKQLGDKLGNALKGLF